MSSCDPCTGVGENGAPAGGGAPPAVVTLQAALDGQNGLGIPTEQAYVTTIDLNAGGAFTWRDASNAALVSIADTSGLTISQQLRIAGTSTPAALGAGNNNNYAPGTTSNSLRLDPNAAGSTITGITGGAAGRVLEIFNIDTAASITLTHDDTGNSTAANCFLLPNALPVVIPPFSAVRIWYDTTSSRWRLAPAGAVSSPSVTSVQDFTSSGNFDAAAAIAAGFTMCRVIAIGPGGGGGGGAAGSATACSGGTGGGGGARAEADFRLSELTSPVAVTVGTGGTGGAGATNNAGAVAGSNGNGGSGPTSFGTLLTAYQGAGGAGGGTPSAGAGGGGGGTGGAGTSAVSPTVGGPPGPGLTTGATGGGGGGCAASAVQPGSTEYGGAPGGGRDASTGTSLGASSMWGGAGGGTGGFHSNVPTASQPSAGGAQRTSTPGTGGAAGVSGALGTAGANGTAGTFTTPGSAGGGGGSSDGAAPSNGANGGNGGTYGNGGGGGGAARGTGANPATAGSGGNGANGALRVILW